MTSVTIGKMRFMKKTTNREVVSVLRYLVIATKKIYTTAQLCRNGLKHKTLHNSNTLPVFVMRITIKRKGQGIWSSNIHLVNIKM